MQLKKITLHNIRSYEDGYVEFPEGSLLLSGEAGSGKSSILLGIEFALFGLGKGKEGISSDALLRRGKDEAYVQLFFTLDGKEIELKRNLKRKTGKIQQIGGYIVVNGQQENLSADELRTKVLQLFNYPLEFIKKGKGLPFHYTVYTQQEQMKSILLEGADLRLNTLRRVFGVDRYKSIQENSDIFLSALLGKIKERQGAIFDLPEKQEQLKAQEGQRQEQEGALRRILPELENAKRGLARKKAELDDFESKQQEINKRKQSLSARRAEISSTNERIKREEQELKALDEQIAKTQEEASKFSQEELATLSKKLIELQAAVRKKEQEIRNFLQAASKAEAKKEAATSLQKKIQEVDVCPECGQKVTQEHKTEINERATKDAKDAETKIIEIQEIKQQKEQEKISLEKQRAEKEAREKELRELRAKADSLQEKIERKQRLEKEKQLLFAKIKAIEQEAKNLEAFLEQTREIEEKYPKVKKEFEEIQEKERSLQIKKAGFEKIIENLVGQSKILQQEIQRKEKFKNDMIYLKELREWISTGFSEILLKVEQSVLATLHSQFGSLLKTWFSMLIEEPEISIRLDSEFSPIVEQAGYDTDYSHLSGGERTAVALAYRLALNQVINSLISQIKTKDLLILDEPTEGFSDSQLDKMRNVLMGLNLKQLIIISHNPKMEGFVDNIIRIRKEGHVSKVV